MKKSIIVLLALVFGTVFMVSFCWDDRGSGQQLRVLEDSIIVLENRNIALEVAVAQVDSAVSFRMDSLRQIAESNARARAAARARASELEQQLRAMIPDTAQAILDSLVQQMEVERQRYQVDSVAAEMRQELLYTRIERRDDRIKGLEERLEAEIELSNYWKREADPSFFEEIRIGAKYVAIGAGAALIIEGLVGG